MFSTAFGGREVVVILERDSSRTFRSHYQLLATSRTSTLERELSQGAAAGYELMGMTVGETAVGGHEVVAIMRRVRAE